MRTSSDWQSLLTLSPDFLRLERMILSGQINSYTQISPEAFSWHGWDLVDPERLFRLLQPFLQEQIRRARTLMPALYSERLAVVPPLHSLQDWERVPLLVKDDDPELGLSGFREQAIEQPLILKPRAAPALMAFGSGGSLGQWTPTFVSRQDREREIQAWRRGHDYHGLMPGDRVLYTYNTTHKGGQWMQESLWAHGLEVLLRRPEEGPEQVLKNLKTYAVNLLFTVQPPLTSYPASKKASVGPNKALGIDLQALIMASLENPEYRGLLVPETAGQRQVQGVFLGGFEIVPEAIDLAQSYLGNMPLFTLLGSSEAIPQACSTNPDLTPGAVCHHNHLHLLPGPHLMEVVKPQGDAWVSVAKGETGLLVYTSWARDGTIWIRYAPGDTARMILAAGECDCGIQTPVIGEVRRKNPEACQALLLEGCASG